MKFTYHKIITFLVLASFMAVVFLSFPMMVGMSDNHMTGTCSFSVMGVSLCAQDTLEMVINHISAYQSFLNVVVSMSAMSALFLLFIVAYLILGWLGKPFLPSTSIFVSINLVSPPETSAKRKITRWLSLFENSPSLA